MATRRPKRRARFSSLAKVAGHTLFEDGDTEIEDLDAGYAIVRVHVADDAFVRVVIEDPRELDEERLSAICSCGERRSCGHVYAAMLELREFRASLEMIEAELLTAEAMGEAGTPGGAWRQRLSELGLRTSSSDATPAPKLEFFVTPKPWLGADAAFCLEIRSRVWRKRERRHGPLVQTAVPMDALPRLPAAERRLLEAYDPHANHNTYHWNRRTISINRIWPVSGTFAPSVLALLEQAACVWLGEPGGEAEPLQIDVRSPFRFAVQRREVEGAGSVVLHGVLARGEQQLPMVDLVGSEQERDVTIENGIAYLWDRRRILAVDFVGAEVLAQDLLERGDLELPVADEPHALAMMAELPGAAEACGDLLQRLPVGRPTGVVKVRIPTKSDAPIRAELQFDYDGEVCAEPIELGAILPTNPPQRRDVEAERALAERCVQISGAAADGEIAEPWTWPRSRFAAIAAALHGEGVRLLAEDTSLRVSTGSSGSVTTGLDWFEVRGEVEFPGYCATLPELLRSKVRADGFVELGDGSLGLLPEHWLRRLDSLRMMDAKAEGDALQVRASHALLLDAMLEAQAGDLDVDAGMRELQKRLAGFERVEPLSPARAFRGELRPYQRHGLGWLSFLRSAGLGGCLADDMGLGKTVQVLAHLQRHRHRTKRADRLPCLLVAPRSVLANWQLEAERFTPDLRVLAFDHAERWAQDGEDLASFDLVLTTYGLLRTDVPRFEEQQRRFDTVILDEAQAIKNATSQTAKAVRLLRCDHRLALTGTPVENHLGELWSLFEFLNPGMLGRLRSFRELFASGRDAEVAGANRELIQRALRPVMLRRTKQEVLSDLPEKVEQVLWCDLEGPQRRRYHELRDHYRTQLLDPEQVQDDKMRFVALEALLRLRQAACHEGLVDKRRRRADSAKFAELLPRLTELAEEGHKVLVFSQFVQLLDMLATELRELGIAFERLDGRTRRRQEKVDRFQSDPACPVFLISLKAGGTGLNLTAADYVFLLDPWWNPAVEQQAIDRSHRIGQQRTVHAYRLACRGTVEERVLELQDKKRALVEAVLGSDRSLLQDLTREDLELLLR